MRPLLDILDYEAEAVEFVQQNIPDGTDVGFSGGKDSVVVAKLMELSGIKHTLTYSFTGLDAPEVVRFIRHEYSHCQIFRKGRTFWRDLAVHSPPSDRLRWCCTLLKKTGTDQVQGIRAEESSRRASRPRINTYKGRTTYYPILYWKEYQVWEFIKKHDLPYLFLYDEGFDRIGCVVCPYHSEKTGRLHKLYRDRWPYFFERFEREISKLYFKRVEQGKEMAYPNPKEFLQAWYLDDSSRWYKKTKKQIELFE
jgi:phosphoadenosine phosphosulfate reductase